MIASVRGTYFFAQAALVIGVGLAVVVGYNSGCTGPKHVGPCDFIEVAKRAAMNVHPFSPYGGLLAVDRGASAYVHQPDRTHEAGVLIDKQSCRVCKVDHYSTVIADFLLLPGESNGPMLAYSPPIMP